MLFPISLGFYNNTWCHCCFLHVTSWDRVFDRTVDGRTITLRVVMDEYTRECLAVHVVRRIGGKDAIDVFADLMENHRIPEHIRSDHGPEIAANRLPVLPVRFLLGRGSVSPRKMSDHDQGY